MHREDFLNDDIAKTDLAPPTSEHTLDIGENVLPLNGFAVL
jgi:hypothetical protein